jgi:hypothetical protein
MTGRFLQIFKQQFSVINDRRSSTPYQMIRRVLILYHTVNNNREFDTPLSLPAGNWIKFLDMNNSMRIGTKLKSLLGVSVRFRISPLMKKRDSKILLGLSLY